MVTYRDHLQQLDHLHELAWREAKRLRSTVIGPEEYLLAILHPEMSRSIAAQSLRDCGITREAIAELCRHHATNEIDGGPQLNPAGYRLVASAEGIAAGLGASQVTPEHVLLAFLWDPDRSALQLKQFGSSREQVRARLAERGVDLPQPELPSPDPRRWGTKIDVPLDELWILLRELLQKRRSPCCLVDDGPLLVRERLSIV